MTEINDIEIRRLKVKTFIGVPDLERAKAQEIHISLRIGVNRNFAAMGDDLANTLDYAAIAAEVRSLAGQRPRQLIETLASEIADQVMTHPAASGVEVVVEKFVVPDTDCVAVRLKRSR